MGPFGKAGCGGQAGAGMYAQSVTCADILGVPAHRAAHQHVAHALAPRDLCRKIAHIGVALTQPLSWGELESYTSFVPHKCGEAGFYVLIL